MDNRLYGNPEKSPLGKDIDFILKTSKDTYPAAYVLTATIHTEKSEIEVLKINYMNRVERYAQEVSGYGDIMVTIPTGDYYYRVWPNRDHLEIVVKVEAATSNGALLTDRVYSRRFKAVFDSKNNPTPVQSSEANDDLETLNHKGMSDLRFELLDLFEEPYLKIGVEGSYRKITTKDLIENLSKSKLTATKVDAKPLMEVLKFVEPDNKKPYDNLVLPANLDLKDLPAWLQEKGAGVYGFGIGNFLTWYDKKRTYFVYPLLDFSRFKKEEDKAVIVFAPPEKYGAVDFSYRKEGKVIYILTTSTPSMLDTAGNTEINQGVGYSQTSSKGVMSKPAHLKDGKVVANPNKLNTNAGTKSRRDGMNTTTRAPAGINSFHLRTTYLAMQCSEITIGWNNGNHDMIFPGMPCKCIYMQQGQYTERLGTIAAKLVTYKPTSPGASNRSFVPQVQLTILLEPKNDRPPQLPKAPLLHGASKEKI